MDTSGPEQNKKEDFAVKETSDPEPIITKKQDTSGAETSDIVFNETEVMFLNREINQVEQEITIQEVDTRDKREENTEKESETEELQPTITEIIEEKEMALIRKSLEEDEIDINKQDRNENNIDRVDENKQDDQDNTIDEIEVNKQDDKENNIDSNENQSKRSRYPKSKMKKSYVDFISDEEDFEWDSTSWKDTGNSSTSTETNEPQRNKKKVRSKDGKVGDVGTRKKKINKRKAAKSAREKGRKYVKKDGSIVSCRSFQPNPCLNKPCWP